MGNEAPGPAAAQAAAPIRRDLFVSYASADLDRAHALRVVLEASGYSCWMAPDDIAPGAAWAGQIASAVAGCRVMLVLVSQASVSSRHVPKEAELAFGKRKPLIPIRLEEVAPSGALEYLLSLSQWIDLFPGPMEAHAERLLSRIAQALAEAAPASEVRGAPTSREPVRPVAAPPLVRPRSGARRLRRVLFAVLALTTIIVSILSFVRADASVVIQARELSIDPNPARVGTTATIYGWDWAPGSPVDVQWAVEYGSVLGSVAADATGAFAVSFAVPVDAAPGVYQVWACQYAPGTACSPGNEFQATVSTPLTVTVDTPPHAVDDRLMTSMGQPLVIEDAGLIANDVDPDGDPLCSTVDVMSVPSMGSLTRLNDVTWLYSPVSGVIGRDTFTYRVCDWATGAWSNSATVAIDIVFEGTVSVSPTNGLPGSTLTVTGLGFVADSAYEIWWEQSSVAAGVADGAGAFSAQLSVGDAAAGRYTIRACVGETDICASVGFEVTSPPPPTTAATSTTAAPPSLAPPPAEDPAVVETTEPVRQCDRDVFATGSLSVDPPRGPAGTTVRIELEVDAARVDDCELPAASFLWNGDQWGSAAPFTGGTVRIERAVPDTADVGTHEVLAILPGPGVEVAVAAFAVTASIPAVAPEPANGRAVWPWLPIGGAAVVGGWFALRGWRTSVRRIARLHATAQGSAARAAELRDQARSRDAELEACEQSHGRRTAALPTGAWINENAGGTEPYLLEFENPYAPSQEDGHRGWYHPRRKEPIRGVVVHTTDGLTLPNTPADNIARFFASCRTAASAHAVVDERGAITLLPDGYTALHMPLANSASLGLIICLMDDADQQRRALAHAARWCRVKAADHEFPFERVDAASWRIGGYGMIGHAELDPTAPDPSRPGGKRFPWKVLLSSEGGPSKFLGLVPVKRRSSGDPCAAVRKEAARAHKAAEKAARRAANAAKRGGA